MKTPIKKSEKDRSPQFRASSKRKTHNNGNTEQKIMRSVFRRETVGGVAMWVERIVENGVERFEAWMAVIKDGVKTCERIGGQYDCKKKAFQSVNMNCGAK